jgi:amino acid transporter
LFAAIGVTTIIYVLIQVVCIGTLPELASSARPLADASSRFLGPAGAWLIASGAMISIAGTIHGHILTSPRMLFAMAEQGQLPKALAALHRRFLTPYISIVFSAIVILCFALSGTFIKMAAISVMTRLAIYIVTCVALPILRRKQSIGAATFTLPWGLVIPSTAIALCGWLLANSNRHEAWLAAIAAGVGLLLYGAQRMRTPVQSIHRNT